MPNGLLHR
jgi:hypothetical protein